MALGDLHGCAQAFERLLEALDLQLGDKLIVLGDYMLRWEKLRAETSAPHVSGKTLICGHTSQKDGRPLNLGHAICIDTYAHGGGWLSCLDVESGALWMTNQDGALRTERIEAFLA